MSAKLRGSRLRRFKRQKIAKRHGWKCHYCGKALTHSTATLDHIVPVAMGGTLADHNLCLACRRCNSLKGDKPPHVFMDLLSMGLIA